MTFDVGTQTERKETDTVTKKLHTSMGCVSSEGNVFKTKFLRRASRCSKRRKSAETQTRLTRNKFNRYTEAVASNAVLGYSCPRKEFKKRNFSRAFSPKRGLSHLQDSKHLHIDNIAKLSKATELKNPDSIAPSSEHINDVKNDICVIETFNPSVLRPSPVKVRMTTGEIAEHRQKTKSPAQQTVSEMNLSEYVAPNYLINTFHSPEEEGLQDFPLTIELPQASGGVMSFGTQTSPRSTVSVGIVTTRGTLYDDLAFTMLEEGTQGSELPFKSSDTATLHLANTENCSAVEECNNNLKSNDNDHVTEINSENCDSLSISKNGCDYTLEVPSISDAITEPSRKEIAAVPTNLLEVPDDNSLFLRENLLMEDESILISDRNLCETNTRHSLCSNAGINKCPEKCSPSHADTRPKLSGNRSSSIETQTEHDVLLGILPNESSNNVDHQENSSSIWCTSETQTCEEFSAIEQFLHAFNTQNTELFKRELFPELSFADTHTQTGIEDFPFLVHSHTQTNQ